MKSVRKKQFYEAIKSSSDQLVLTVTSDAGKCVMQSIH